GNVATALSRIASIPHQATTGVASAGPITTPTAGPSWTSPLARPSAAGGTSAGTAAWAAGTWIESPRAAISPATARCQTASRPVSASPSATTGPTAATASAAIITVRRGKRSTRPMNGPVTTYGRAARAVSRPSHAALPVSKKTYTATPTPDSELPMADTV